MPVIRPFKCVRPAEDKASAIAALPYDVYNRKEAKEVVKNNALSFLKIDRGETQFPDDVDMYSTPVYERARQTLEEMLKEGSFVMEEEACYFLYALTYDGQTQTGIVGCASVDDYLNGKICRHENTKEDKEQDRIRHVDTMNAQTGPIFLAYRRQQELEDIVCKVKEGQPLYDFTSEDGVRHQVWKHPDYTGEEAFNYFLSVLFPENELRIFDYNRVVTGQNGLTFQELLEGIQKNFHIEEQASMFRPAHKGDIGMYGNGRWYRLSAHEELYTGDPVEDLDVSVLQNKILEPLLGILNPKAEPRLTFVGGIRGLDELKRLVDEAGQAGEEKIAFAMYPTSMEELLAVADCGRLMPPKSTWFEPKLRSGLFIHMI